MRYRPGTPIGGSARSASHISSPIIFGNNVHLQPPLFNVQPYHRFDRARYTKSFLVSVHRIRRRTGWLFQPNFKGGNICMLSPRRCASGLDIEKDYTITSPSNIAKRTSSLPPVWRSMLSTTPFASETNLYGHAVDIICRIVSIDCGRSDHLKRYLVLYGIIRPCSTLFPSLWFGRTARAGNLPASNLQCVTYICWSVISFIC